MMISDELFTAAENEERKVLMAELKDHLTAVATDSDYEKIAAYIDSLIAGGAIHRNLFGLNPIILALQTAKIVDEEMSLGRDATLAVLLYYDGQDTPMSEQETTQAFGASVAKIVAGLRKVHELYAITPVIQTENFRNLLLTFAEDMRVVLIMIADRLNIMRQIRDTTNIEAQRKVAEEASYLYAPLAHKLGLYRLKSELEDLSLKYLEHDSYYMIRDKLSATKATREAYIEAFITPVEAELKKAGLKCHVKGRTKSIHSIWQKMKKQQCGFEGIYDLFAI